MGYGSDSTDESDTDSYADEESDAGSSYNDTYGRKRRRTISHDEEPDEASEEYTDDEDDSTSSCEAEQESIDPWKTIVNEVMEDNDDELESIKNKYVSEGYSDHKAYVRSVSDSLPRLKKELTLLE